MKRLSVVLGYAGTCALAASLVFVQQSGANAQGQPGQGGGRGGGAGAPAGPPAPTNLQVLPKETTAQEIAPIMQGIAAGLGVQCNYCHVPPPAPAGAPPAPAGGAAAGRGGRGGGPQLDFAADDKPEKKTARVMLQMVNTINGTINGAAEFKGGSTPTKVECVTCHRGVAKPEQISDILARTMTTKGESAALVKYREMRTQYYGSQSYDFSEPMLLRLGQQSIAAKKADDAVAWLKLNLEFYPKSAGSYVAMAQAHLLKNDRSSAVKDLEQALSLDANNAQAKRQLEQLKAQN
jgi:hypothetical protein